MRTIFRRNFIAAAGACGAVTLAAPVSYGADKTAAPFDGRKQVNPAIDNLTVVCGVNPAMITGTPSGWSMEEQNGIVDREQVEKTLNAMAMSLTKTATTDAAWQTVFRKPVHKEWSAAKAAIKVNCIAENHPRLAVVNKICIELLKRGVKAENIIIYDGIHNAASFYSAYVGKSLPGGVLVSRKFDLLGGTSKTFIPEPDKRKATCAKALAENTIDLLVDIAVNKGHSQSFGGTTLTMKNHAGTFDPKPLHTGGGMDYLIAFNKSDAIRGTTAARQQLCIIDSLWGARKGPGGPPDKRLDRLIMGTLSPVVDYQTAKNIREPLLGSTHKNIERFITEFGYRPDELPPITEVTV
ncbi:MAG: DUF362 domain-containing protein [Chitinispirillaceae bacterium]|nr:DUF362 domain-containing protein [Chitinispirillaceae bacterium]